MTKERTAIVVLAMALVVLIAWALYPSEPLGKRLRRECQSVIDEVYPRRFVQAPPSTPPNPFDKYAAPTADAGWEQAREREVETCIMARVRAGR